MYGYFRPKGSNLTNSEKELFDSYYCRICYCLRIIGGQSARFFTTYDATMYSLIIDLQEKGVPPKRFKCEKIGTKVMKQFKSDEVGLKLARLSLISVGEKIRDDQLDSNCFKAKVGSFLFLKKINKARDIEPTLTKYVYEGAEKVNILQKENAPLEEIFKAYGDAGALSISQFINMTLQTEELVRSLSEWIFLVDMIDDYDDDYKNGTYNGFKTEGLATFNEYFDTHYNEFLQVVDKMSTRLVNAINAVKDDSAIWNILYKIIMTAVNTVIPNRIMGENIKFNLIKDSITSYNKRRKLKKLARRLKVQRNEKN